MRRLIALLLCVVFTTVSFGQEPYHFAAFREFKPRVTYGKVIIEYMGSRDKLRHSLMHVNGDVETVIYDSHDFSYVRANADATIKEHITQTPQLDFSYTREAPSEKVELIQPSGKWTALQVTRDKEVTKISAPSLWHLYLVDQELCKSRVSPFLYKLNVFLPYEAMGDEIESNVMKQAAGSAQLDFIARAGLVHDLASPLYDMRKKAYNDLKAMGPSALPLVGNLAYDLDREQLLRIQKLKEEIYKAGQDTPERLTLWLADDAWIWGYIYLNNEDARPFAADRIKSLTGLIVVTEDDVVVNCMTEKLP